MNAKRDRKSAKNISELLDFHLFLIRIGAEVDWSVDDESNRRGGWEKEHIERDR